MNGNGYMIMGGTAHPELTREVCAVLDRPVGEARVLRFSDGETRVEIDESVRGADVFVLQPTCGTDKMSPNDAWMEVLIMADALKRASAGSVSAVVPYFGYGRQDRRGSNKQARSPISARLMCDLLQAAGVGRIISMELHAGQIQGFFNGPVDHLYASPVLVQRIRALGLQKLVVVSPDAGGTERARAYAKALGASLAIIDKRRSGPNEAEVMHVIGEVEGCDVMLIDDMIDTAGTITTGAAALVDKGARRVFAATTHPVLSGPAIERIGTSPIERVIVTNTLPLRANAAACPKIVQVSIAGIVADGIRRVYSLDTVTGMPR